MTSGGDEVMRSQAMSLVFALLALLCCCSREEKSAPVLKSACKANEVAFDNCGTGLLYKIRNASTLMLDYRFDHRAICQEIAAVPDEKLRLRLFEEFMDSAAKIDFGAVTNMHFKESSDSSKKRSASSSGDGVSSPSASDTDKPVPSEWRGVVLVSKEDMARRNLRLRYDIAYGTLQDVAEEIWTHLFLSDAPQRNQWEPLFKYFAKMQDEQRRTGDGEFESQCMGSVKMAERFFSLSLRDGKVKPDELEWFKRRFEETVGRPPKLDPSPQ